MRAVICGLLVCALAVPALAGKASHWTHSSEADFKEGSFHNVVATNLGELKLSRAVKTLLEQDPRVGAVYALAEGPDKTIYVGTGPQGVLLQIKDQKVTTLATLEGSVSIDSLLVDKEGRLWIGTGGEKGRIFRINNPGDKPQEIFSAEGVQYIWAMQQTPDGMIYAATGPTGTLFALKGDGSHEVLYKSDEHNLLCLLSDGGDLLYFGTDPDGRVYRLNRKTKEAFVLYDAAESEISCLALDAEGNLYAGTAEASDQMGSAADDTGSDEKTGRPEDAGGGKPISGQTPTAPKPPDAPKPAPGEPAPIPQAVVPAMPKAAVKTDEGGDDDPKPGQPPANPPAPSRRPNPNANPHAPAPGQGAGPRGEGKQEGKPEGNAIYRIDRNGFVTEVFREPVLVMSLVARDGVLLVGTGNEGLVYQVDPAAEETLVLAKLNPKQVTALLTASDGTVYLGLANVGGLATMSSGYASEGTYTSPVLDASQVSRFGKLHLEGSLPSGTSLKVATRSGNVHEPDDALWSKWSADVPATVYMPVQSPQARFLQYRLTLASADSQQTPVVDQVDVAYQGPTRPPQVKSIKVAPAAKPHEGPRDEGQANPPAAGPNRVLTIAWEASDPNDDALVYTLYFRPGTRGPWILLKDKLKDQQYDWDTRTVADGPYQIKVVASNEAANPPGAGRTASRVSETVLVDNTPPVIGDLKWEKTAGGVQISFRAVDRSSVVSSAEYSVDSSDDWQAIEPSDKIADSPEETYSFTVPNLKPGPHQVAIRATDSHGNQAYENVLVTVDEVQGVKKD